MQSQWQHILVFDNFKLNLIIHFYFSCQLQQSKSQKDWLIND